MKSINKKFSILPVVISVLTSTHAFATGQDAYGNATPTTDNTGSNYQDFYYNNGTNPYFQQDTNGTSYFVDPKTGLTDMEVNGERYTSGESTSSGTFNNIVYDGNDYNVGVYEGANVSSDGNGSFVTIATTGNGDPTKNNVVLYKNYADSVHLNNDGSSMFIDSNYANNAQISNSNNGYMLIKQNSADSATITNAGAGSTMDIIGNTVTGADITNTEGTINIIENSAEGVSLTNNSNSTMNIVGNNAAGATITNNASGTMNITSCTTTNGCQSESSVNADQATITNAGNLNVSGDIILSNSSFNNTGTTTATGNIDFLNTTLQNEGTLNITDGFNFNEGTFENDGVMNVSGTGSYSTQVNNNNVLNIASNTNIKSTNGLDNKGIINLGDNITYSGDISNEGSMLLGEKDSSGAMTTNITGNITNTGNVALVGNDSTTTINIAGDVTNSGNVYLTNAFNSSTAAVGNVLNVDGNLNGDGNYYMQTQMANDTGDLISVTGAVNGNNKLFIKDTGVEPTSADSLTVVKSGQAGTGSFALNLNSVDIGTYRYGLEQQGNDWTLVNEGAKGGSQGNSLSTGANAAVGMHSATASMWEEEMGSLMNRMGDLRLDTNRTGGVWVRQLSHEIHASPDSSRSYQQQYNGTQVGVDKAFSFDGGVFYLGAMTGFSRSTLDFKEGANGSIKSQTYGLYGTAIFDNGYYLDTVAKYGHMKNKISYHDNAGQKIKGDYTSNALGLSVEGGKRFTFEKTWFIEPQLQLTASHLRGRSYSLSNGMEVKSNSMDLFNGRAGIVAGTKMTYDNVVVEPYVEVSHIQEFSGTGRVVVNNNRLDSDQIGTRQRYGAGVNFNVAKQHNFFINASYENGSKMEQPWGVKAGYQFRF